MKELGSVALNFLCAGVLLKEFDPDQARLMIWIQTVIHSDINS